MRFIAIVLTAFLDRVKPVSTIAKPACMNITRNPHPSTQARFCDSCRAAAAFMSACSLLARRWGGPRRVTSAQPHQGDQARQDGDDQEGHDRAPRDRAFAPPGAD